MIENMMAIKITFLSFLLSSIVISSIIVMIEATKNTTFWLKFITLKGRGRKIEESLEFKDIPSGKFYKIENKINKRVAIVYLFDVNFKKMLKVYIKFPESDLKYLEKNTMYHKII